MKIEQIKIVDLKEYKLNAKVHPEAQIDGLAESIRRFGWTQPIVVDASNEIVIGHGRVRAATKLGMESVPCLRIENLNENEIRGLRIFDNRIAETSWDIEMLKVDLQTLDFGFETFGGMNFDFVAATYKGKNDPDEEWEGMPEYESQDLTADNQIIVSFRDNEARAEFAKLIGQSLTEKTRAVWFPKEEIDQVKDLRY